MIRRALLLGAMIALGTGSAQAETTLARAYLAGGCFWCVEADFEKLNGVLGAVSGYMGGQTPNPDYPSVSAGGTGHTEAVEILYDPDKISYEQLLHHFWRNIDPLTANAQFCDKGSQYRSAIFTRSRAEREAAEASKARIQGLLGKTVVTEINDFAPFTVAEDYHQDYYKKNPVRYRYYRHGCGRDKRLKQLWGSTDQTE